MRDMRDWTTWESYVCYLQDYLVPYEFVHILSEIGVRIKKNLGECYER